MSEYDRFQQDSAETDENMSSLLKEIDLQICLMRIIKSQIESLVGSEKVRAPKVRETNNRYGKSGYMADVELDDCGEITAIRYDWVEP